MLVPKKNDFLWVKADPFFGGGDPDVGEVAGAWG